MTIGRLPMSRAAAALTLVVLLLSACTSSHPPTTQPTPQARTIKHLSGTVADKRTGAPLADATIASDSITATTDTTGSFTVSDVARGGTLTVSHCGYSSSSVPIPTQGTAVAVTLKPLRVIGHVKSNLTKTPLHAEFKGDATGSTKKGGSFVLYGVCPGETLTFTASGYAAAKASIPASGKTSIMLEAGPAVTEKQLVAWDASQQLVKEWSIVHPDSYAYIDKDPYIAYYKDQAAKGYVPVSVDIKGVTFITWTFPRCTVADFGPKVYRHTAAIRVVEHDATPNGGESTYPAVYHFVQTPDGLWRWFPNLGCSFRP
jgi:hypothetical protein